MPDLLLELLSEEIPARMQARAAEDLSALLGASLTEAGIPPKNMEHFSGPRRLAVIATGLPASSPPAHEERKGPRVGAPDKAIEGFLRSAGLQSLDECEVVRDPKGDYYLARLEKPGQDSTHIVAAAVPTLIQKFPWPKSMRWGDGSLRWIRPLQSILCLLDKEIVPFQVDGVASGDCTYGHRFMSGKNTTRGTCIKISQIKHYTDQLMHAKVVSSREQRAEIILKSAGQLALDAGLALAEDHGLLSENAGLAEWPVVLSASFDPGFLTVPAEILMTSMKTHQKCFSMRDANTGALANQFILVANLEAEDGGKAIVSGNERVIRARLSDAKFFWENDKARPLTGLVPRLGQVTFHEKLGTQLQRVHRLESLAREIAPIAGADAEKTSRAAHLAKADLMTGTVGEFPELQGIIGRYIALEQGEDADVANAIADHYKPQGPSDAVPENPVSIAVALADKIDMLAGFFAIDEKPTGSKDPFALRRAALGIIRIVLENGIKLRLGGVLSRAGELYRQQNNEHVIAGFESLMGLAPDRDNNLKQDLTKVFRAFTLYGLQDFFKDRLKFQLREQGARHDLIDAVFALPDQDDLVSIVRRVEALGRFLAKEDGANLLAGVKRAHNILRIEEKKDGKSFDAEPVQKLLKNKEEKALGKAIKEVSRHTTAALAKEDFEAAMGSLARLREPVDLFFEHVTVNADDAALRENRLRLLAQIRNLAKQIADFSKIEV